MYFDEIAAKWDTERRIERARVLADKIYKEIDDSNNKRGLEIGCGTGLISFELKDKLQEIYCSDISSEMLKVLKRKIEKYQVKNMHIYNENKNYLQDDEGKFDVVYSSMAFHHIDDIENELKRIHDLLRENGQMIIIDLDKEDGSFHKEEKDFHGHNGFDRDEFRKSVERCGFKKIEFKTIYEGEKQLKSGLIKYSLFMCSAEF